MTKKRSATKRVAKSMTPYLTVQGAAAAIEFYKAAFNAREVGRTVVPGTELVQHAELKLNGSSLFVCDEFPELGILSPLSTGATSSMLDLRVADADALWTKALAAGAIEVAPMVNVAWGGCTGKLVDPFGHYWSVSGEAKEETAEVKAADEIQLLPETIIPCASDEAVIAAA